MEHARLTVTHHSKKQSDLINTNLISVQKEIEKCCIDAKRKVDGSVKEVALDFDLQVSVYVCVDVCVFEL